jgi:hypothetical protein
MASLLSINLSLVVKMLATTIAKVEKTQILRSPKSH